MVQSRRSALLALKVLREKTIQAIRELLFVALTECGGPAASLNTACSHRIEKISHVKPGANILGSMQLASWAECVTTFFDNLCGKRNVTRDDEITGIQSLNNFIVSDIESSRYLNCVYVLRRGRV